jgi:hypothetical protein
MNMVLQHQQVLVPLFVWVSNISLSKWLEQLVTGLNLGLDTDYSTSHSFSSAWLTKYYVG